MNEMREPMHQPPNPDDLRRAPPASPACARVRGWLRDFVDRDLDAVRAVELEEHVHGCRTCAVELARTEHETMRLRSALAEVHGARAALPPDFAARVVERLVLDETSLVTKDTLARATALASVQAEAVQPVAVAAATSGREAGPRVQPAVLLIASLLLLWGLTFGVEVFGDLFQRPQHESRLVVVAAADAFSYGRRLGLGDGLGENQMLRVGSRGAARVDFLDPTTKTQPVATLQVHSGGEVSLVQGAPRLHGAVDLDVYRAMSVTLSDGSQVDLGEGSYTITAEHVYDDVGSLPADLRVHVEVRSGEAASIVRSGLSPTLVAAGEIGVFEGNGRTTITTMGSKPALASAPISRRQADDDPASASTMLIARTIDQSGSPVAASLRLRGGRSHEVNASVSLGNDGMLQMRLSSRLDTDFLVVNAAAPEWRDDLGVLVRDAVRLVPQGDDQALADPLKFVTSQAFAGQVVDESAAAVPCEGVLVVPCIVDDLFGAVLPMTEHRVTTDAYGGFRCMRLPATLPPHQSLRLLLLRDDLEPTVVTIPERSGGLSGVSLPPIRVKHTHAAVVHLLPANAPVEILEEIPSLPGGTGFVRRRAVTDNSGTIASIQVGGGNSPVLWYRDPVAGHGVLRQLSVDSFGTTGTTNTYRPSAELTSFASRFGATAAIPGSDVELVATSRHDSLADAGEGTMPVVLQFADSSGLPVIAQVFVVDAAVTPGRVNAHFAGFTALDGVVTVRRRADQSIVAIDADGRCAIVGAAEVPTGWVSMPMNGRLVVPAALRPGAGGPSVLWLHMKRTGGARIAGQVVSTTRLVGVATEWVVSDLLPGEYTVTIGSTVFPPVVVPAGGFAVLGS